MAGAPARPHPFRAERYELGASGLWLSAVSVEESMALGVALAAIDPWARYGTTAANLAALLTAAADGGIRLAVRSQASTAPIGVMVIRYPWLVGPYMQFLAVLPGHQGAGVGQALLGWFEAEARSGNARNLWICAADFNERAQSLYARFGFEVVVSLDDLIKPGIDEILMRKQLTPSGS